MFFFIGRKNYLVTEESFKPYHQHLIIKDVKEYISWFVSFERFIYSTFDLNPFLTTQIVLTKEDFDYVCNEWINYFNLGYEEYNLIWKFNSLCIKYMDEFRLCDRTIEEKISETNWIQSDKINRIRSPEEMPSELLINSLDKEFVQQKYLYFITYSIYNAIKEYQLKCIQKGLKIPEIFDKYSSGVDTDAFMLKDYNERFKCIKVLLNEGFKIDGFNQLIRFQTLKEEIEYYIQNTFDFGFIDTLRFKFNPLLMKHIKNKGIKYVD